MIIYYGIPGDHVTRPPMVKFGDNESRAQAEHLPRRDVLAEHGPFDWGYVVVHGRTSKAMVAGAAAVALAVCSHALADDNRALALYQRFKMRVMNKWSATEPWAISVAEVSAVCDAIETDAQATERERRTAENEKPPAPELETGRGVDPTKRGIVWDTDDNGQRIIHEEDRQ